jgi:hypothetical protein
MVADMIGTLRMSAEFGNTSDTVAPVPPPSAVPLSSPTTVPRPLVLNTDASSDDVEMLLPSMRR